MWTNERIAEAAKCIKDPIYCLQNYVWMNADEGIIPFNVGTTPNEAFYYQFEIIKQYLAGMNIVILKNRRAGLSWIAAFLCWHGINFHRGWDALLVSRTEKESVSLLKKVKFIHNNLAFKDAKTLSEATPAPWLANQVVVDNQRMFAIGHSDHKGELTMTSTVSSLTTTKHSGRGEKTKFVFVDEVQFIENQEEVFGSVLTTAARAGQWMMGSNAGDVGTRFHHLCLRGKSKENKTYWYREVWPWEVGISEADIEAATEALPDDVKRQEWYLEFKQPGNAVFDITHLSACFKPPDMYPEIRDYIAQYRDMVIKAGGALYYYSGVDSAVGKASKKSKEKDYNCYTVLSRDGVQVFTYLDKKPISHWAGHNIKDKDGNILAAAGKVSELHRQYPGLASIEENGPGILVINRHELPNDGFSNYRVISTSHYTKSRLIKQLIIAIESHSIVITDDKTYQQLSVYQYGDTPDTYEAPRGFNDDAVMALAMALDGLLSEGLHEFAFGDIDSLKIDRPVPVDINLDNATVAPAATWNPAIQMRLDQFLPLPFNEEPKPIDTKYLPRQDVLDYILGEKYGQRN